jgi:hypothetical protein
MKHDIEKLKMAFCTWIELLAKSDGHKIPAAFIEGRAVGYPELFCGLKDCADLMPIDTRDLANVLINSSHVIVTFRGACCGLLRGIPALRGRL